MIYWCPDCGHEIDSLDPLEDCTRCGEALLEWPGGRQSEIQVETKKEDSPFTREESSHVPGEYYADIKCTCDICPCMCACACAKCPCCNGQN